MRQEDLFLHAQNVKSRQKLKYLEKEKFFR